MNIIGRKEKKNIDMWQYVNKILLTLQRCEILRLRMKPKNTNQSEDSLGLALPQAINRKTQTIMRTRVRASVWRSG